MRVGVIGLGDLGIANVALLASFGYEVVAYDSNAFRVSLLNKGLKIFKDERIKEIIVNNKNNVVFTNNLKDLSNIDTILISVDLDCNNDAYSLDSFYQIIDKIKNKFILKTNLIIKTPLPIGTCRTIDKYLNENKKIFTIAYMPSINFEKDLYESTFNPKEVIVGTISPSAHMNVRLLYEKFLLRGIKMLFISYEEAEMYKIAKMMLEIECNKFITNMQCLYNEYNLDSDSLLSTLKFPEVRDSVHLVNTKRSLRESNNLNFFLRSNYSLNKTLEEGNLLLAKQIVNRISSDVCTIGIFGISDSFNEINILIVEVINLLLKEANKTVLVYDNVNEENLKKLIGVNRNLKYAFDEKSLVKKSDAILILNENEIFKTIKEDFYLKHGRDKLIVYDFAGVYKYCKWKQVKIVEHFGCKRHQYKSGI